MCALYKTLVLLFGVFFLNSNKLFICPCIFLLFSFMVDIGFANVHRHVYVENQATPPYIFHLERLSAVVFWCASIHGYVQFI